MPEIVTHLVSTIIPVYNRPGMIQEAVESVLAQDYCPVEIIIVDDGSTDDTLQSCHHLAAVHEGLITVLTQKNRGPGPAREVGRKHARGEFIQYLDSDDRLLLGKFSTQVAALRAHPDCGIAYGVTRLVDFASNVLVEPFKWTGRDLDFLFPGLLVDRWWCTHTPLYRRSVCEEIGPWSNLRYSQDWEYDARAGALGTKLVTTQSPVSEHRTHAEARQTGHGKWLSPEDQVRFFSTLYQCAVKAGGGQSVPEMQHFSRWVFSHARQCGLRGDESAAQQLYDLALRAAGSADWTMRLMGSSAAVFGWRFTSMMGQFHDAIKRGVGKKSQPQSWMKD
ncbi:MAG: glycosyltransferase family 2 protein [Gammaproteobacteria bacterium]|nr:glycosyltransferase family 2 protein [Gammaproteobacteria bacterium]